ncbi:Ig-like domain-containing protein, partial [candidate division KSB1 bacterium]
DLVTINITPVGSSNQPPLISIIEPQDNQVYIEGGSITFQATASDTEDGIIQDHLTGWTSDKDGKCNH